MGVLPSSGEGIYSFIHYSGRLNSMSLTQDDNQDNGLIVSNYANTTITNTNRETVIIIHQDTSPQVLDNAEQLSMDYQHSKELGNQSLLHSTTIISLPWGNTNSSQWDENDEVDSYIEVIIPSITIRASTPSRGHSLYHVIVTMYSIMILAQEYESYVSQLRMIGQLIQLIVNLNDKTPLLGHNNV